MFDVVSLEEPLLGNGCYAYVRAAGRPARRARGRCRRVAAVAACRDHRRRGAAGVLRSVGASSWCPRGGAGRSPGVRPTGPPGVAQATLALPELWAVVDDAGSADRVDTLPVDNPRREVGDVAGRPSRPLGRRGR